jgi:hypothetical protein
LGGFHDGLAFEGVGLHVVVFHEVEDDDVEFHLVFAEEFDYPFELLCGVVGAAHAVSEDECAFVVFAFAAMGSNLGNDKLDGVEDIASGF